MFSAMEGYAAGETEGTFWSKEEWPRGQQAWKWSVQAPCEQLLRKESVPTISSGRHWELCSPI